MNVIGKQCKPCKTCHHPRRGAIDKELTRGVPTKTVAEKYGLSEASVRRHRNHIRALVLRAKAQRDRRRGAALLTVEQQYEEDGKRIDTEIAEAKSAEDRQRWFLVKFKWYDLGLKYGFLNAWLRRDRARAGDEEALPEPVKQIIDAVVRNDE